MQSRNMIAASLIALAGQAVSAQQTFVDWSGSDVNGNLWNQAGNWSPAVVPNNADGNRYVALITGGTGVCNLNMATTVDKIGVGPGSTLNFRNDADLSIVADTVGDGVTGLFSIENLVTMNSTSNYTMLVATGEAGTVTLGNLAQRPAELRMSDSPFNLITGNTTAQRVTFDHSLAVTGAGDIGANVLTLWNLGAIRAGAPGGVALNNRLKVDPGPGGMVNEGAMGALANNTLRLDPGIYENAQGQIGFQGGGTVELRHAVVRGGVLRDDVAVVSSGTSTRLENVYLDDSTTNVVLSNDRDMVLAGTVHVSANTTIQMGSTSNYTDIALDGDVLLGDSIFPEGGRISMSNSPYNRIYGLNATETLFNESMEIRGAGEIGVNLADIVLLPGATIVADQSHALVVNPRDSLTNDSMLIAENGGTLELRDGMFENVADNRGIRVRDGSLVYLQQCTVRGGHLISEGSGLFRVRANGSSTALQDVRISEGTTVELPNDRDLVLRGVLENRSKIDMNSTSNYTDLQLDGPVTLTGGGEIDWATTGPYNRLYGINGVQQLVIEEQTIRGGGELGVNLLDIVNHGSVIADQPNRLIVDPANVFTNRGEMRAESGGTLRLEAGRFDNQTSIEAKQDSVVDLRGCEIVGGTLRTFNNGLFSVITNGDATVLDSVTLEGEGQLQLANNRDLVLRGSIVNRSTIDMNSTSNYTDLQLDGPVTLTGGGEIDWATSGPYNRLFGINGVQQLVIEDQTIRGAGELGVNLLDIVNRGAIIADQPNRITIDPANAFVNEGVLHAASGSRMRFVGGGYEQHAGKTVADGVIDFPNGGELQMHGGQLSGHGQFAASVHNVGGTVAPGSADQAGSLAVTGELVQGDLASIDIRVAGAQSADLLEVSAAVNLDGVLNASLLDGFTPARGDRFTIITAGGGVDGRFRAVTSPVFGDGLRLRAVYHAGSVELLATCAADFTTTGDSNDPGYGVPDGQVDATDFFYYLDQFATGNVEEADITGSGNPDDPDYLVPDGTVDATDFFVFLDLFVLDCG